MEAFLAKELFSVMGFSISPKTILKVLLAILVAVLLWLAYSKVRDHFQHITDLENQNKSLTDDKTKLQGQLETVKQINKDNATTTKTAGEQQAATTGIANVEQTQSTTRATKTKEISDAIDHTPPTATPVDPVITNALDSLWN